MHKNEFTHKEGDYVSFHTRNNMVGHGTLFQIMENDEVIVQTGNGGRGLEYVKKKDII